MNHKKRLSKASIIFIVLALTPRAYSFKSESCLAQSVTDFKPATITLNDDGTYEPINSRVWAFTALSGGTSEHEIKHVWVRQGQVIDAIARPIRFNRGMYSYKNLTSKHLGPWEHQSRDQNGKILSRIPFEVILKDQKYVIHPLTAEAVSCPQLDSDRAHDKLAKTQDTNSESSSAVAPASSSTNPNDSSSDDNTLKKSTPSDESSRLKWFIGAEGGIAPSLFSMNDNVGTGRGGGVFAGRRFRAFGHDSSLALGFQQFSFSKDKDAQSNSADDSNLTLTYLLTWHLTPSFDLSAGVDLGASTWKASSANKNSGAENKNSGVDPSVDLVARGSYYIFKNLSVDVNLKYRQTFQNFNEQYIPFTLGITYDFGGRL